MTDKAMSSTFGNHVVGTDGDLSVARYGRFWAVYDNCNGCDCCEHQNAKHQNARQLICVTVYKKGAREVVRRLQAAAVTTNEG